MLVLLDLHGDRLLFVGGIRFGLGFGLGWRLLATCTSGIGSCGDCGCDGDEGGSLFALLLLLLLLLLLTGIDVGTGCLVLAGGRSGADKEGRRGGGECRRRFGFCLLDLALLLLTLLLLLLQPLPCLLLLLAGPIFQHLDLLLAGDGPVGDADEGGGGDGGDG